MLYRIQRDLQKQLVGEGWGVRVYISFESEWYLYFKPRLAKRLADLL